MKCAENSEISSYWNPTIASDDGMCVWVRNSASRPVEDPTGGPKGMGAVNFDRGLAQYLEGRPHQFNIETNRGFTAIAVVKFTGVAGSNERMCSNHSILLSIQWLIFSQRCHVVIFNIFLLSTFVRLNILRLNMAYSCFLSQRRLEKTANIADLRMCAKKRSHKMVFDYLHSGADDEIMLKRAKDVYSELEMHYHCLVGLQLPLDLSTTIFSEEVNLPFFGCPAAGNHMFHAEGESAAARAAQIHGTMYALSSLAATGINDIQQM